MKELNEPSGAAGFQNMGIMSSVKQSNLRVHKRISEFTLEFSRMVLGSRESIMVEREKVIDLTRFRSFPTFGII